MAHNRFINKTLSELEEANRSSIYGYQNLPVLTLEETVETIVSLVPSVGECVSTAKKKCNKRSTLLTLDESAAIYLYSMPTPFVSRLNAALRLENQHLIKPWLAYLKLFISALEKLPSTKRTVWRGVCGDARSGFIDDSVHIWWSVNSCSMALDLVEVYLGETGTVFAIDTIYGRDISAFSAFPEEQEIVLIPGTHVRAKGLSLNFKGLFFLIHLEEEQNPQSESHADSNYLFGLIKQKYQQNSRIERIMNPSRSFPIEQSYINLAIVKTKEQQGREKKLLNAKLNTEIIGTFEEIYGAKTEIEIRNIFETCMDQTKKILVLGRAGIGKTTFCRYVTYQWSKGAIWQEYDLVVLIQLRHLTESRYPPGINYSQLDLVKKEYFHHGLSEKDERLLKEQFDKSHVLWLLDGYDEIIQNISTHLKYLLEQLLTTPHHILTSRPYLNTLSYNVQLEITGFTNDNIKEYVTQFFTQIDSEIGNVSLSVENVLSFLEFNPRIWGIVHTPVNLELICSLWCNTDWSETKMLTMTNVYDTMTEWLCRRHAAKQTSCSTQMRKEDVYIYCYKELAFLESLAFNGMKSDRIILPPNLLQVASEESECSLHDQPHVLNIGVLKSADYKPIGTFIEAGKSHYFVHLSFQEHFAARYLAKALNSGTHQKEKAIDFIKTHKYNQRFELVFTFASGLLINSGNKQGVNLFWDTLLGEPFDLIGLRHVQILVSCIEETGCDRSLPRFDESINAVTNWIKYSISEKYMYQNYPLAISLRRSVVLFNQPEIVDIFVKFHQHPDPSIKKYAYSLISDLQIVNPHADLILLYLEELNHHDVQIRARACEALGSLGEKEATNEIINGLVKALGDRNGFVRENACEAIGKLGEKAATNEILNRLVIALSDWVISVQGKASEAIIKLSEKPVSDEVINRLVNVLGNNNVDVRRRAFEVLVKICQKTATDQTIDALVNALGDTNVDIRRSVFKALVKIGKKTATNQITDRLTRALENTNVQIRRSACEALGETSEKAAINETIDKLVSALDDTNIDVRISACEALVKMDAKAAINEIINRLVSALDDMHVDIRRRALQVLLEIDEKAATDEIIIRFINALGDSDIDFKIWVCDALVEMGEKLATPEICSKLVNALFDTDIDLRIRATDAPNDMSEKSVTHGITNSHTSVSLGKDSMFRSKVYDALTKIGEKAATNEIISRLVSALGDTNVRVKYSACEAVRRIGKKTATKEIIAGLTSAVNDMDIEVRRSACETLKTMGEKVATIEIITSLTSALEDTADIVRGKACDALAAMGAKAATNEIIIILASTFNTADISVRWKAWDALVQIVEKAVTSDIVSILLNLLDDQHVRTRCNVCDALGRIGEKTATKEIIAGLTSAVNDMNVDVRISACRALGRISEKTAINEIISRLVSVLGDTNVRVKYSACEALRRIGEKTATKEIIAGLTCAVNDMNVDVRISACKALGRISEKTVTNEIINSLASAVYDTDINVRRNACVALMKITEQVAIIEVANRLTSALSDTNFDIRARACEALVEMSKKEGPDEVITGLTRALGNTYDFVRIRAYEAISNLGEKASSNEIIDKLTNALGDTNVDIRRRACEALGTMGGKAATNDVITVLLVACCDEDSSVRSKAGETIGSILSLLPSLSILKHDTVSKLAKHFDVLKYWFLNNTSPEKFIRTFLDTGNLAWLSIIRTISVGNGYGITLIENIVTVYGSKGPVELSFSNKELGQQLHDYFASWLHKYFESVDDLAVT